MKERLDDGRLLDLLWQYLRRTVYDNGLYESVEQGISLGCPLSPLMGALFLDVVDKRMEATGLLYVRFMDDWVVLAPSRWKLRRAIAVVNQTLAELRVRQHPDKTFIGRISRGFDFLGYRISPQGVAVAAGTVMKFVERMCRLYEQGADAVRIGDYVRRWKSWATATGLHVEGISLLVNTVGRLVFTIGAKTIPSDQGVAAGAPQHPAHWRGLATVQPTLAPGLR